MIIPAILESSFDEIVRKLKIINEDAAQIQIDVVDKEFTNHETFMDIGKLDNIEISSDLELDLMVRNPISFLEKRIKKVTKVCFNIEFFEYVDEFIERAKKLGYKVGLSLNPETELFKLNNYLTKVDYIQFLTIKPGKQGNEFIPAVLKKIAQFRDLKTNLPIQVDGGVSEENLKSIIEAGADDVVVGSHIWTQKDPVQEYAILSKMFVGIQKEMESIKNKITIKKIAFLGGAAWKPTEAVYKLARETAGLLAENGYEIVNGGGPGVMKAATQGAHDKGGRSLAITYHPNKIKRHYEGVDYENHFDEEVITLDYFDRTKVMLQNSDVHVIFSGSIGTLSEFGMTWVSSWIHEGHNKPIILVGGFWHEIIAVIKKTMILDQGEEKLLKVCVTSKEILDYVRGLDINIKE